MPLIFVLGTINTSGLNSKLLTTLTALTIRTYFSVERHANVRVCARCVPNRQAMASPARCTSTCRFVLVDVSLDSHGVARACLQKLWPVALKRMTISFDLLRAFHADIHPSFQ